MAMIKNLAFKGGGVLGIAYAGAITVLEQKGILKNIEKVSGTSAGAITAALVSLNYTAAEIHTIVQSTDFKTFEDKKDPLRLLTKYGIYKGDALLAWIEAQIVKKGLPANATFTDFKNKGCKDLYVFASDLNIKNVKAFSFSKTPNVVVAEAIRASMSIPFFFSAYQFRNNNPDNHMYVDGGMVYNFPITYFDSNGKSNPETMGLYLSDLNKKKSVDVVQYDHIIQYIKAVFSTIMDAQVIDFENDQEEKSRTAIIDNLGISAVNFDITKAQQDALYASGVNYTTKFIEAKLKELVS
jgi:NTE family protein